MESDAGNPFANVSDVPTADEEEEGVGNPFAPPRFRPTLQRTRSRSLNDVRVSAAATASPAGAQTGAWQATPTPTRGSRGRARSGSVSLHRVTSAPNHARRPTAAPPAPTSAPESAPHEDSSSSDPSSSGPSDESKSGEKKHKRLPKFLKFRTSRTRSKHKRRHTFATVGENRSSRSAADDDESTSSDAGASSSSGGAWVRAAKTNELKARAQTPSRSASIGLRDRTPPTRTNPPPLGGGTLGSRALVARAPEHAAPSDGGRHTRQTSAPILRPAVHQALERADRAGKNAESAAARADVATQQLRHAGSDVRRTVHDLQTALGQDAVFASPTDVATMQRDAQRGRRRIGASGPTWPADDSREGSDEEEEKETTDDRATRGTKDAVAATTGRAAGQTVETADRRTTVRVEYPPFRPHARPNITIETHDGERAGRAGGVSEAAEDASDTAALQATLQPLLSPVTRTHLKQAREALLDADAARTSEVDASHSSSSFSSDDSTTSGTSTSHQDDASRARASPATTTTPITTSDEDSAGDNDALTFFISDEDSLLTASSDDDEAEAARGFGDHDATKLLMSVINAQFRAARRQQQRDLAKLATLVDQRAERRQKRAHRQEARARTDAYRTLATGVRRATRTTRTAVKAQHKRTRAALAREREGSTRALAHVLAALEALVAPVEQQVATTDLFRRAAEDIQAVVGAQHELTKRRFERLTEEHDAIRRRDTTRIRSLETHAAALQRENEQLRFELRRDQRVLQDLFTSSRGVPRSGPRVEALTGPDLAGSSSSDDDSSPRPRLDRARATTSGRTRPPLRTRPSQVFRRPVARANEKR